jgi:hypothetical protein
MSRIPNFILCVSASAVEAKEMLSFSAMGHVIKRDVAETALTLYKHLTLLMFLFVQLGGKLSVLLHLDFHCR